jgi:hypothetical protein
VRNNLSFVEFSIQLATNQRPETSLMDSGSYIAAVNEADLLLLNRRRVCRFSHLWESKMCSSDTTIH